MANKTFLRNFNEFRGLDLYSSHLSRDPKFATEFTNCEVSKRKSVIKRKGFKLAAQFDDSLAYWPLYDITEYRYFHPDVSRDKTEIIGIGFKEMFTLRTGTFTVYGPGGSTISFLPSDVDGNWYFDCKVDGVSVGGNFPYNCGSGATETPTLYQLLTAVNALGGGWSATLTPHAVVDGSQTGRDHSNPVLVKSGHTLTATASPGDYRQYEVQTTTGRKFFDCIDVTGNNVRFKLKYYESAFNVNDGALIGAGLYPAAILPACNDQVAFWGYALKFTFWEAVYRCHNQASWSLYGPSKVSLKQSGNVLFVGTNLKQNTYTYYKDVGGALKYDSSDLYVAGLPGIIVSTPSIVAGTELGIGRYKYLFEWVKTDAVGNEIHGNATDLEGDISVTTTSGNQRVSLTLPNLRTSSEFGQRSARISAPSSPGHTFSVDAGTNSLRLGDWVYFKNLLSNRIVCKKVVALTDTSVTIEGPAAVQVTNVPDSFGNPQNIVSNALIRVFRTKLGGLFYYLVVEPGVPNDCFSPTTTWVDAVPDNLLGEMWEGPFVGRDRRDMPPPCPLLENHQGLLVGIGDPDNPTRLYWSNYESPEYWPKSTNYQDITSTGNGPFTAMASSSTDTLLLFKEDCYKPVSGDLFYGNISLTADPQTEIGCPSHRGVITFNGGVFFLSKSGPRMIVGDSIQPPDRRLTEAFYHEVDVRNWTAAVDIYNHRFIFCPPGDWKVPILGPIYTYDYVNDVWQTIETPMCPFAYGGFLSSGKDLYLLGGAGVSGLEGRLFQQIRTNTKYDYIDAGGYPIRMVFRPQWDFLDEPCLDKEFLRAIVWSISAAPFIPFELTVKTYRNFNTEASDTVAVVTFSSASEVDKQIDLVLNRSKALQFEFSNERRLECPHITGYEIEVALPYRKEHVGTQTS